MEPNSDKQENIENSQLAEPVINFETIKPKKAKYKYLVLIGFILSIILAFITGALLVWYFIFDGVALS